MLLKTCSNCIYKNACNNFPTSKNFECWVEDKSLKGDEIYFIQY